MEENTQVKKEDAEILENEQKGGKKKWMKYAKIGFLLLVAVFLVRYFYKNYDSYKNLDVEINWLVFTGAVLFVQSSISRQSQHICIPFSENTFREKFYLCLPACRHTKKEEHRSGK